MLWHQHIVEMAQPQLAVLVPTPREHPIIDREGCTVVVPTVNLSHSQWPQPGYASRYTLAVLITKPWAAWFI